MRGLGLKARRTLPNRYVMPDPLPRQSRIPLRMALSWPLQDIERVVQRGVRGAVSRGLTSELRGHKMPW